MKFKVCDGVSRDPSHVIAFVNYLAELALCESKEGLTQSTQFNLCLLYDLIHRELDDTLRPITKKYDLKKFHNNYNSSSSMLLKCLTCHNNSKDLKCLLQHSLYVAKVMEKWQNLSKLVNFPADQDVDTLYLSLFGKLNLILASNHTRTNIDFFQRSHQLFEVTAKLRSFILTKYLRDVVFDVSCTSFFTNNKNKNIRRTFELEHPINLQNTCLLDYTNHWYLTLIHISNELLNSTPSCRNIQKSSVRSYMNYLATLIHPHISQMINDIDCPRPTQHFLTVVGRHFPKLCALLIFYIRYTNFVRIRIPEKEVSAVTPLSSSLKKTTTLKTNPRGKKRAIISPSLQQEHQLFLQAGCGRYYNNNKLGCPNRRKSLQELMPFKKVNSSKIIQNNYNLSKMVRKWHSCSRLSVSGASHESDFNSTSILQFEQSPVPKLDHDISASRRLLQSFYDSMLGDKLYPYFSIITNLLLHKFYTPILLSTEIPALLTTTSSAVPNPNLTKPKKKGKTRRRKVGNDKVSKGSSPLLFSPEDSIVSSKPTLRDSPSSCSLAFDDLIDSVNIAYDHKLLLNLESLHKYKEK